MFPSFDIYVGPKKPTKKKKTKHWNRNINDLGEIDDLSPTTPRYWKCLNCWRSPVLDESP